MKEKTEPVGHGGDIFKQMKKEEEPPGHWRRLKRQGRKGSQQDEQKEMKKRKKKGSRQGMGRMKNQRRNLTHYSVFLCDEDLSVLGCDAVLFVSDS
jgi:hypothetical protein